MANKVTVYLKDEHKVVLYNVDDAVVKDGLIQVYKENEFNYIFPLDNISYFSNVAVDEKTIEEDNWNGRCCDCEHSKTDIIDYPCNDCCKGISTNIFSPNRFRPKEK